MLTREDAWKIAKIIGDADGGCAVCVRGLAEDLTEAGLGWRFVMTNKSLHVLPSHDRDWDGYRSTRPYVKPEAA